jgi:co-chaperonin GroES (HSP10)
MIQVSGPRALVKRLDQTQQESSIIEVVHLSDAPPSQFAMVIAAGNGERLPSGARRPLGFKAGDMVITKPYCGALVPYDLPNGDRIDAYMVMEEDVLAVCEGV